MSSSVRAIGARARQEALRTLPIAAAAFVGAGLLLAACSGTAGTGSSSGGGAAGTAPHQGRVPSAQGVANGAAVPGAGAAGSTGKAAYGGASGARLALSTQSIIYTAELSVRVSDVTAQATEATGFVTAVGGYVSSEQEIIPPGRQGVPQINLELKIPAAQFSPTLAKLKAPAFGKSLSFNQHSQNVTQQVADVNSRVVSAQAAIKQLRALLTKAGSVSQLLSVQNTINNQESNLEALLAQQRALAHETSYATVTVLLVGHHARIVKKHHKKAATGFLAGLRGGWHALVLVVGWLLTVLGSALPFLIPVALIGGIAFESRRRLARRKIPPAAEPPAASAS